GVPGKINRGSVRLSVVGCGDAFGSGGRLQTCFHVALPDTQFLIDCGATALIGLQRLALNPNNVDTIVLSHLHGDHYAGLVWWIMHAQYVSDRSTPLTVIGPEGTRERYLGAAEVLFPGSTSVEPSFDVHFQVYREYEVSEAAGFSVQPFPVSHPSGALSSALRIETEGRVIAFSGDTEWKDELLGCAAEADIFICECFGYRDKEHYHMSWTDIEPKLPEITAQKILLTHLGEKMLANLDQVSQPRVNVADDGMIIDL
ncbi:MAG: MBL fold metallo-hydrolase, partial [Pseudomonadota bacterium]